MGNQQPMNGNGAGGANGGNPNAIGRGVDDRQIPGRDTSPYGGYIPKPSTAPGGTYMYDASSLSKQQQQQQKQKNNNGTTLGSSSDVMDSEGSGEQQGNANNNNNEWIFDDTVPTVFRWEHGGRQVYITGTFNGWSRQIPMHRSGNDFTYIHNLKRGKHAFKFIVDNEWRFAPDQPTVADIEGRINNFIDVTEFKAYTGDVDFEKEKAAAEYGCFYGTTADGSTGDAPTTNVVTTSASGSTLAQPTVQQQQQQAPPTSSSANNNNNTATAGGPNGGDDNKQQQTTTDATKPIPDRDGEVFGQTMPDLDEYTKEPPPLPPHLRHIILNKPPQLQDTAALPVPQHVALNHLYCTAIRDNMMVLGITQRYKTKFVTTVYYSPCASK